MDNTPTKARYIVTAFAVTLAVITYIDRVGISVAAPLIREDLKLTPIQMGWALSATLPMNPSPSFKCRSESSSMS